MDLAASIDIAQPLIEIGTCEFIVNSLDIVEEMEDIDINKSVHDSCRDLWSLVISGYHCLWRISGYLVIVYVIKFEFMLILNHN